MLCWQRRDRDTRMSGFCDRREVRYRDATRNTQPIIKSGEVNAVLPSKLVDHYENEHFHELSIFDIVEGSTGSNCTATHVGGTPPKADWARWLGSHPTRRRYDSRRA